ncbi:sialidase family protein [Paenibacillus sp. y28]|uniref:sialidase family protein n=1 Tax=Paenibacillus sp. y28 TaxID=3129110 RepID=UPI003018A433
MSVKLMKQEKQFLFEEDRPFPSCHASTIVTLPDGGLLISYFAGSKEGAPDEAIWCSRQKDGVWSPPYKVADEENLVHWNPVLHRKESGEILLFYKVGYPIPQWYTRLIVSLDDGQTWSEPVELVPGDVGGRGPVKNKLIVLQDGTWAAPASLETPVEWDAFVDLSFDEGATWTASGLVPVLHPGSVRAPEQAGQVLEKLQLVHGRGIIQPTLWESAPGQVHMLLRSTAGFIYRSDSADGGRTWSPAYKTYLPNNNSGIDLAKMENGTLVLAYNPVGMYKGPRTPLLLSVSSDNGYTWEELLVLEREPGEYSYPAVLAEGNRVYVTYTWKRERIVCWSLEIGE